MTSSRNSQLLSRVWTGSDSPFSSEWRSSQNDFCPARRRRSGHETSCRNMNDRRCLLSAKSWWVDDILITAEFITVLPCIAQGLLCDNATRESLCSAAVSFFHSFFFFLSSEISAVYRPLPQIGLSAILTRKPCCGNETVWCRSCSFRF